MMSVRGCVGVVAFVSTRNQLSHTVHSSARSYFFRPQSTFTRDLPPHSRNPQPSSSRPAESAGITQPNQLNGIKSTENDKKKPKPLQKPRNEAINYKTVRLSNPETGALDPPVDLQVILDTLRRDEEYLELVVEQPEPIVKIINTRELYARKKAKRVQKSLNRPPEEKEVQLTWGVGIGDLQNKLKKVREDLEDNNRVTLVFAPKKGQQIPNPAGQSKIVEEMVRLLEGIGRERKERNIQRNITALYMESTRPQKQAHELRWDYTGDRSWTGLKAVESALRQGARVEVVFITPPVPKKKKDNTVDPKAVDPEEVKQRLERTLTQLEEVGKEWRPRDNRKFAIVAYLEGIRQ